MHLSCQNAVIRGHVEKIVFIAVSFLVLGVCMNGVSETHIVFINKKMVAVKGITNYCGIGYMFWRKERGES
jgi:hypothetical protein